MIGLCCGKESNELMDAFFEVNKQNFTALRLNLNIDWMKSVVMLKDQIATCESGFKKRGTALVQNIIALAGI